MAQHAQALSQTSLPAIPHLIAQYDGRAVQEIIQHVVDAFAPRVTVVSSFGAESVVLLHMLADIAPATPIIFLNTGKLFGETLRYRDRLQNLLGLTDVRSVAPLAEDLEAQDPKGMLWDQNPDACCHIRKVLPQNRALAGFDVILTGRKRFQTTERRQMALVESETTAQGRLRYRINPLANWSIDQLKDYILEHKLPRHPLEKDGYLSIGCMPCTQRVKDGGDYRSGRWAGKDKDECGIHGEGI